MIFKPEMVEKILAGEKTVTRRPVKFEIDATWGQEPIRHELPCRYEVGRDYAIQPGRGQAAVGRLRVIDVRRGLLAGIDDEDAEREGFDGADAFRDYWLRLYRRWSGTQLVDRIEFELVPDSGARS